MKHVVPTVGVALALVVVVGAYHELNGHATPTRFVTESVSVGDVVRHVAATGSLEAVTTVEVGTQVSGTISQLGADFNSLVRKGQVIARLDPTLIDTQIRSARSLLAKTMADADAARVAVDDATVKLSQARALHDKQLIPDSDLDAAEVALKTARATLESNRSQAVQAQASLGQALVNRAYTIIRAPIDGIVVARNVDIGQTVAASYQAPTLFVIAADLSKMQLSASIDESDIGMVRPGQNVQFTVDAYPQETFDGTVKQIRLQPDTVQNVVTYTTEISVDNADLRLKPGMTATLNIEIARAHDVLRVPTTALRYVPRASVFTRRGQPVPKALEEETAHRPAGRADLRQGIVWAVEGSDLRPVRVTVGLSDGSFAEVTGSGLGQDTLVATGEIVVGAGPMAATPLNPRPLFR